MGWRNYRHRFTPWIAANWRTRLVKYSKAEQSALKQEQALAQLSNILQRLSTAIPPLNPKQTKQLLSDKPALINLAKQGKAILRDQCGFTLAVQPSHLQGGGSGVFIDSGDVRMGQLVALYPGTVYFPFEPLLLQSLGNSFIFRCIDGVYIDGKPRGLSGLLYRSCAFRDVVGSALTCDTTWLSLTPANPLAVGQIVNNHTREVRPNVEYVELTLPNHWPLEYYRFVPNVLSRAHPDSIGDCSRQLRTVGLMATRDISTGEELYSSYFTVEVS